MSLLLLYDTQETDLARDIREFLMVLGAGEVEMIPLAPDLGTTLEDKERAYLERADGAVFVLTPGCERNGLQFPSPSVNVELGWMKALFARAPGRVVYLVDERCTLPAIDQKARIQFDASKHRSVIQAITQLARNLGLAPLTRPREVSAPAAVPPTALEVWTSLRASEKAVLLALSHKANGTVVASELHERLTREVGIAVQEMNFCVTSLTSRGLTSRWASAPPATWVFFGLTPPGMVVAQAGAIHEDRLRNEPLYSKKWHLHSTGGQ